MARKTAFEKLQYKYNDLQGSYDRLHEENENLSNRVKELEGDHDALNKEVEGLKSQLEGARRKLSDSNTTTSKLKQHIYDLVKTYE